MDRASGIRRRVVALEMLGWLFGTKSYGEARSFPIDEGGDYSVVCVDFSPDGSRTIVGLEPESIRVWDVQSGTELYRFEANAYLVENIKFSFDGSLALSLDDASSDEDEQMKMIILCGT